MRHPFHQAHHPRSRSPDALPAPLRKRHLFRRLVTVNQHISAFTHTDVDTQFPCQFIHTTQDKYRVFPFLNGGCGSRQCHLRHQCSGAGLFRRVSITHLVYRPYLEAIGNAVLQVGNGGLTRFLVSVYPYPGIINFPSSRRCWYSYPMIGDPPLSSDACQFNITSP